jgi:hypothetical protein
MQRMPCNSIQKESGWGLLSQITLRFLLGYWLLYALQLLLSFPRTLVFSILRLAGVKVATEGESAPWWAEALGHLSRPNEWFDKAMNWFTPWITNALLHVEVEVPKEPTGSGDGLFMYCTSFAYLVLAAAITLLWTGLSEAWRFSKGRPRPNYDRLHSLLRFVLRFYLFHMMIVYGAAKLFCSQFPPVSDAMLERKLGDSSPMGFLWHFMMASQPYTIMTGIIEFTCGLLLIFRKTTLLGAICSAGATFQVFMLNMCYDVPVKLLSGHLLLISLLLIAPDAKRLFSWFVLGRAAVPTIYAPLFGSWTWLNRTGTTVRILLFFAFAATSGYQSYLDAVKRGIFAPEYAIAGRWIMMEFIRDGQPISFPPQPDSPAPKPVTTPVWNGGPEMPAIIRAGVGSMGVMFMFEDGSGTFFLNNSEDNSEMDLTSIRNPSVKAKLGVTYTQPERLVLEGQFDGREVRMTFRRPPIEKKGYIFRSRKFQWVQERPYNP